MIHKIKEMTFIMIICLLPLLFTLSSVTYSWCAGGSNLKIISDPEDNIVGIKLGKYNSANLLASDPFYNWHTFYGTSRDFGHSITLDDNGNIYITGESSSAWNGPLGEPPLRAHNGWWDCFVLKLNSVGAYQWHTFFGSADYDDGRRIIVDKNGNLYIAGRSNATWNGPNNELPLHGHTGDFDLMVLKLNNAGTYQWHTFFGSAGYDEALGIALDEDGNLYVTGDSDGTWNGPGSGDTPKNAHNGNSDLFVLKLNNNGGYQWHTFYGSQNDDYGLGMAMDSSDNVYIVGSSFNNWNGPKGEIPLGGYNGDGDGFVLKLNRGGDYQWHTFYGSSNKEMGEAITIDLKGMLTIVGYGTATWNGPKGEPPLHPYTGGLDILVLQLDSAGAYQWHTFYGGNEDDAGYALDRDNHGHIYITGYSNSGWNGPKAEDFPLNAHSGYDDVFVLKLNNKGMYTWHTFYGSKRLDVSSYRGFDQGEGIALDQRNLNKINIFITGSSDAPWDGPEGEKPLNAHKGTSDNILVVALKQPLYNLYLPLIHR